MTEFTPCIEFHNGYLNARMAYRSAGFCEGGCPDGGIELSLSSYGNEKEGCTTKCKSQIQ